MGVIDRILGFYEDIREFNSSNIKDFRGRLKSWIKMGMLAGRIFYLKDMWARDVAALTFASFMALIPFMAMMFVIARGFAIKTSNPSTTPPGCREGICLSINCFCSMD